jgi:hypothetical protein
MPAAATVFPAGPRKGFKQRISSPNKLFDTLAKMQEDDPSSVRSEPDVLEDYETEEQKQQRESAFAEQQDLMSHAEWDNGLWVVKPTSFWPGATVGESPAVRVRPTGATPNVFSLKERKRFVDPTTRQEAEFIKAILVGDAVQSGWIRSDTVE